MVLVSHGERSEPRALESRWSGSAGEHRPDAVRVGGPFGGVCGGEEAHDGGERPQGGQVAARCSGRAGSNPASNDCRPAVSCASTDAGRPVAPTTSAIRSEICAPAPSTVTVNVFISARVAAVVGGDALDGGRADREQAARGGRAGHGRVRVQVVGRGRVERDRRAGGAGRVGGDVGGDGQLRRDRAVRRRSQASPAPSASASAWSALVRRGSCRRRPACRRRRGRPRVGC